ncbi:helix-turn-helix domain-containing protein [Paenirhodobacter populi]|nr:helix-turn-helix domain-containing protein [Sinirhodobacter populi]
MPSLWAILRNVTVLRKELELSAGCLTTLRAMISVLGGSKDASTTVYASNRTLSDRANGLCERSIRRHISILEDKGFVLRRSSSNGKRYQLSNGNAIIAFGVDLSPLLEHADSIAMAAQKVAVERSNFRMARQRLSAAIQAASEQNTPISVLDECRIALRRARSSSEIEEWLAKLEVASTPKQAPLSDASDILSAKDGHFVRQIVSINKETILNEEHTCPEVTEGSPKDTTCKEHRQYLSRDPSTSSVRRALSKAFPNAMDLVQELEQPNEAIEATASRIAPFIGVSSALFWDTIQKAGAVRAIIALLDVVQHAQKIKNAAGYFQAITLGRRRANYHPLRRIGFARTENLNDAA